MNQKSYSEFSFDVSIFNELIYSSSSCKSSSVSFFALCRAAMKFTGLPRNNCPRRVLLSFTKYVCSSTIAWCKNALPSFMRFINPLRSRRVRRVSTVLVLQFFSDWRACSISILLTGLLNFQMTCITASSESGSFTISLLIAHHLQL